MGESRDKVIKAIKHYQDSLERHIKTKKTDKLIHAIERLSALPIRVWHLEETGVGRTVNGLKRYEGEVGESARNLVDKWKIMVKDEEKQELAKQEIEKPEKRDVDTLQIAKQPEEVNGNSKKRRHSEEKSKDTECSSKKSKSSHHHVHSKHRQRKKSESEDSDDSDSSANPSPPPKSKSHKTKQRHSSEGTSSSDSNSSSEKSNDDDSDSSESSQSDSKHGKQKESSKHSKDSKHKDSDQHRSKDKSSSRKEPERKHKDSSSSRHKDKSDKENVSSKERSSSSKSSSSSKHKHSNSDKEKSRSSDTNRKSSSKSDSKEKHTKQAEKVSAKPKIRDTEQLINGIDSGSGASFADALGMLEAPVPLKPKKKKVVGGEVKASTSKSLTEMKESGRSYSVEPKKSTEVPSLLKSPEQLEPLNINDLSSLLPSITPNYRPLGMPLDHPRKGWTDEEALSRVISAKHQRTKVYSGNKSVYTKVPTLFDICSRVLQDNLDALEYTGGVPYTILKHILERANPNQLYQLEFHNPYLIEDTDELWQLHCQKEFRNEKREEMETWRDMYMRCLDERDARLKALTANIKQSQDKSLPVRQTKLAYVDSVVKPPRNIARKQAKNGMLVDVKRPSQTPTERLSQLAKAGEASKVSVPNPGRAAADRSSSSSSYSSSNLKPKKAPLMAKTLSLLKNRFGRR